MNNTATAAIMAAIKVAREHVASAEATFERNKYRLESRANKSMDLFGSSTLSQVADIAIQCFCDF